MKPRCDQCMAFEQGDQLAFCHLNPPAQFRDVRNEMWSPFPAVQPDWWCAQWQPAPKQPQTSHAAAGPSVAELESPPFPAAGGHPAIEDDF